MSGMYLPIGDMDIAVCSRSYTYDSIPKYNKRKDLYALSAYIRSRGMAKDDNIEVISRARVPLVKFVDSKTHLKVDFSFEKNDGRRAIQTLLDWQKTYPAMPVIVAVMKQFLMMRGLNEPVSGGIGGLSVTCMVMNLLNQLPQVQSTDMAPEQFLGEILMEFLNYYGNHFQYRDVAIRMNPPELFPKVNTYHIVFQLFMLANHKSSTKIRTFMAIITVLASSIRTIPTMTLRVVPTILRQFSNPFAMHTMLSRPV